MSLVRSLSRKLSGKRKTSQPSKELTKIQAPSILHDTESPKPSTRTMTTANLFQPTQSTAATSNGMDRTLYEIPQPEKVDAMSDLIKDHTPGEFFPYVGVVGNEGESSDARRARLLALKPSYNKRDIPEIKVLGCPLISREGDFTMKTLMSFAKTNNESLPKLTGPMPSGRHTQDYSISKPYIHIRQVTVLYTPNMSSTSNYCSFWMNLIDNRLIDSDKGSQTNVIVSNQEGILEMSCDYCVSTADLASFTLSYTLERDIVQPGFQWGTASFYFGITESDLPYQSSKVDAMAVYRMPITTLMARLTNADKSDISFTPADIVRLRELYSQGDIVDVDEPQKARLKTNTYSKSSIRSKPKGEAIDAGNKPGWEFMQGSVRQKVDAHVASVDPSDDSSVPLPEVDVAAMEKHRKETLEKYKKLQEESRKNMSPQHSKMRVEIENSLENVSETNPKQEAVDNDIDTFFGRSGKAKQVRISVPDI